MRTPSFDYLRQELAIILKDYPVEETMNDRVALDLTRYTTMDDEEIARQLRIAIAAIEGHVVQVERTEIAPPVDTVEESQPPTRLQWLMQRINKRGN